MITVITLAFAPKIVGLVSSHNLVHTTVLEIAPLRSIYLSMVYFFLREIFVASPQKKTNSLKCNETVFVEVE